MTREQTKNLLPVLKAWASGDTVQVKATSGSDKFEDYLGNNPHWLGWEWRVKPTPKEFTLVFCPSIQNKQKIYESPKTPDYHCKDCEIIKVREILD